MTRLANWLTRRRIVAQACALLFCLWAIAALDFSASGVMDRVGNVKFQDFLPEYLAANAVHRDAAVEMYDWPAEIQEEHSIAPRWTHAIPMVYGPQVALLLSPFARCSFLWAAALWTAVSIAIYIACCYLLLSATGRKGSGIFWLLALAYPPLFHFILRGQMSALILMCFTLALLAFQAKRPLLAGIALGFLAFKPPFLLVIPLILALAGEWDAVWRTCLTAAGQLGLMWAWFGDEVMRQYFLTLANLPRLAMTTEGAGAEIQMHSLRAFWDLLIPWSNVALLLYLASSLTAIIVAVRSWKADGPLSLRYSSLVLAAVLVNPHLFIYDLVAIIPVLVLVGDWILRNPGSPSTPKLMVLLYGAYVLPLFGPLAAITHIQTSVIIFAVLQWELWRILRKPAGEMWYEELDEGAAVRA